MYVYNFIFRLYIYLKYFYIIKIFNINNINWKYRGLCVIYVQFTCNLINLRTLLSRIINHLINHEERATPYYAVCFLIPIIETRLGSGSFTADAGLTAYGDAQAAACDA